MNPNTLYANTFADALIASGLRAVCLAPGSRHTPLVLAFARRRDEIDLYSHLDERSAAFFALGLALGAGQPAAIVCTSGSAAANLFPAIVEAHQSRLPLILLTADRPHELRASGANQTIDQIKLFGEYADWFYDAPLPEAGATAAVLRNLRTLAARAFALAASRQWVVHINLPYRKPFEPSDDDSEAIKVDKQAPTRFISQARAGSSGLRLLLSEDVLRRRGLIYFGHGSCRSKGERERLLPWAAKLSALSGFPILAEFTSNMRARKLIGAYESIIKAAELDFAQAEVLIRFGAPPLSKGMQDFFAGINWRCHIYCSRAGEWADDSHSVTHHLTLDPASVDVGEWDGFEPLRSPASNWGERLSQADGVARQVIAQEIESGPYFDGAVLHDVAELTPAGGALFAGSSLPVRHLDQFGLAGEQAIFAYANRGASGIDGNVSTALGLAAVRKGAPLAAVLGDITLYHDMNGLLAVKRCDVPVTIVLLNNGGGGIFQRLPIRALEPEFSDFFTTAHGLDFAHAAALYGLEYRRADDRASFRQAFSIAMAGRASTLIEVRTDAITDLKRRGEIMAAVQQKLKTV